MREGLVALAIVEVRFAAGTHEHYLLALGEDDEPVDAFERPEVAAQLAALAGVPAAGARIRSFGVEQSNSCVVLDELHVLKLYRRLEAGPNPELEILRVLGEARFGNAPRLEGALETHGPPLGTALASVTALVPAVGGGWELALDSLGDDPSWLPDRVWRLGEITAELHAALASHPDPAFSPEEPSAESLGLLTAAIDEEIATTFSTLPEDDALGAVAHRVEDIRDLVQELSGAGPSGLSIRMHGDFHLGQVLWTSAGDWVVIDFEGEPARSLPERRRKRSPLRDVAGMTRSFAYAADASVLLNGVEPPAGWVEACRGAFVDGYLSAADERLLPPSRSGFDRLLCAVRAGEARLRAALRDAEPSGVGVDPAGRASAPARDHGMSRPGEVDLYLLGEGRHERLWEQLGGHPLAGDAGARFAVWAPNARAVSVVGDWNYWSEGADPLEPQAVSGVWAGVAPNAREGQAYKLSVLGADGVTRLKADPIAFRAEPPPKTASVLYRSRHSWRDGDWLGRREAADPLATPMSVYEVHAGSWRQGLGWLDLAEQLTQHVVELGFTHVELMPVMQHPFGPSWGYQVSGYYAPHAPLGEPDDLRAFVDALHAEGIGVLLDWVPAHFPRDEWALARFDGTSLYEHADPRRGAHPDWGTLVFNYGRHEVRNFLLANALYWLEEFHADGLRVDAVASMLYLDYSREAGEWVPNRFGGREDLDAVSFLQELNAVVHATHPGVAMLAEESTAWAGVSRPTDGGGLGFTFKWNLGWMHDTLGYLRHEPVHRRWHHDELTFSMVYAWDENFVLPLSHDEVVHGKGSLLRKMPGDEWQQFATLRALYAHMWAHPGKQLLFMGGELGQGTEWSEAASLDWYVLDYPLHAGLCRCVSDLNRAYRGEPALWEVDFRAEGFQWLVGDARDDNVLAYARALRGRVARARLPGQLLAGRPARLADAASSSAAPGARC